MGTSTNGQLCYGVAFEEDFEFPWGDTEIEDWWTYTVHGFKHSFELFDGDGNYLNGREPPKDDVSRYFEEDFEFPWGDTEIEDWWTYTVHGFKHSFELFDGDGNYLNGREPPKDDVSRYFEERRVFDAEHRLPVALVNYCSGDYPMYAVAVPSTVRTANRGSPTTVYPASLVVADDDRAALLKFFADHGIEAPEAPAWLLTSYWG